MNIKNSFKSLRKLVNKLIKYSQPIDDYNSIKTSITNILEKNIDNITECNINMLITVFI